MRPFSLPSSFPICEGISDLVNGHDGQCLSERCISGRLKLNRARERRITYEIVVDAYTPEECALSWHCYLDDKLAFTFKARCIAEHPMSPLTKGEVVEVLSMATERDCRAEMFVRIRWQGRMLGVPLARLKPVRVSAPKTKKLAQQRRLRLQAIADWHHWLASEYTLDPGA
ncbi:MAG: calcium-binding protein [Chromatiales bacterium]